jgi:hypothetical protein
MGIKHRTESSPPARPEKYEAMLNPEMSSEMELPEDCKRRSAGEKQDEGFNHNYQDSASGPTHNDLDRVLPCRRSWWRIWWIVVVLIEIWWFLNDTIEVLLQPFTLRRFLIRIKSF